MSRNRSSGVSVYLDFATQDLIEDIVALPKSPFVKKSEVLRELIVMNVQDLYNAWADESNTSNEVFHKELNRPKDYTELVREDLPWNERKYLGLFPKVPEVNASGWPIKEAFNSEEEMTKIMRAPEPDWVNPWLEQEQHIKEEAAFYTNNLGPKGPPTQ